MYKLTKISLSILTASLFTNGVLAQQEDTGFTADAKVSLVNDDNIYRVTDDLSQSDTYISIAPTLSLVGGIDNHRFAVEYEGDYAKFSSADDADFFDHSLLAKADLEHTSRFSTFYSISLEEEHEEPGAINRIQLDIDEYNQYNQQVYLAGLAYGREESVGRITANYQHTSTDYTNNDLDFRDYDSDRFLSRFTYRVAPKTKVYVQAIYSDYDYTAVSDYELDNIYKRYQVGVVWNLSDKLTGDINLGYQDRDYDLDTLRDITGFAYDGTVSWAINTYTTLELEARRQSIDSSDTTLEDTGGYLRTSYGLSLDHRLTDRLRLKGDIGYSKDELAATVAREDKRYAYQASLDYELTSSIIIGTYYLFEERDSTEELADYKANVIGVNLKVSLDN